MLSRLLACVLIASALFMPIPVLAANPVPGSVLRILPDDPRYPAAARDAKVGGSGVVVVSVASRFGLQGALKVSTGSPVLDQAMINIVIGMVAKGAFNNFLPTEAHGVAPGLAVSSVEVAIEFVADPNAKPADPASQTAANLPPPVAVNDCGRTGKMFLRPIAGSQVRIPIPMTPREYFSHVSGSMGADVSQVMRFEEQGAVRLRIVVDKDGKPAEVTVTDSSAPPEMEKAVVDGVKANYRWEPPPPECRDRGVMMSLDYINTRALRDFQIYSADPRYPAAAREHKMGATGILEASFRGPDEVWNIKVLVSAGSSALDDAMKEIVKASVADAIKGRNDSHTATALFPVMFMPGDMAAPNR